MGLVRRGREARVGVRLREIGEELGVPSYLVDDASSLDPAWLEGVEVVGVTAGASAPEELVQGLIVRLGNFGRVTVHQAPGVSEHMQFKLPRELADADKLTISRT